MARVNENKICKNVGNSAACGQRICSSGSVARGHVLGYASEERRDDEEAVLAAVKREAKAWHYA